MHCRFLFVGRPLHWLPLIQKPTPVSSPAYRTAATPLKWGVSSTMGPGNVGHDTRCGVRQTGVARPLR